MPTSERIVAGPPGTFWRGNLPDFRRDRLGFLTHCARDYGDVFRLRRQLVLPNCGKGAKTPTGKTCTRLGVIWNIPSKMPVTKEEAMAVLTRRTMIGSAAALAAGSGLLASSRARAQITPGGGPLPAGGAGVSATGPAGGARGPAGHRSQARPPSRKAKPPAAHEPDRAKRRPRSRTARH